MFLLSRVRFARYCQLFRVNSIKLRKMSTHFSSIRDPVTGEQTWVLEEDYNRDIARAAYADMLHDLDRNKAYYAAISSAIATMKGKGRRAIVLDIGTGTGLLSMMASAAGADEIYACECFTPMYTTALKVTQANEKLLQSKIKIIPKRSNELQIGVDLPHRANILVTETFDTELIGEHCISTYNHAGLELMEPDYLAVPSTATVFVQLVSSPVLAEFHGLNHPKYFESTYNCPGLPTAHDLQLSNLRPGTDFQFVTPEPQPLFHFDFTKQIPTSRIAVIKSSTTDYTNAFLFWKLKMDANTEISCFPSFLEKDNYVWREHWIQWEMFIPLNLRKNELSITQTDLDYHLGTEESKCNCGLHRALSRGRIYGLNQLDVPFYLNLDTESSEKNVLFLGDDSPLPIYLKEKYNQVSVLGTGRDPFDFKSDPLPPNAEEDPNLLIISEPYYSNSLSCLQNLQFFTKVKKYQSKNYFPKSAMIKCLTVKFHHLHKIRSRVGETCGFDLTPFDELIGGCIDSVDPIVEYQPLWEYDFDICTTNDLFTIDINTVKVRKEIRIQNEGVNGLIFYCKWDFGSGRKKTNFLPKESTFQKGTMQSLIFLNRKSQLVNVLFDFDNGLHIDTNDA